MEPKCPHTQKRKLCEVIDVAINLMVGICHNLYVYQIITLYCLRVFNFYLTMTP